MSQKKQKPKKWYEVYPQGTKAGDEEQRFFIALSRNPKFDWRSVAAIVKEASLTIERVEEILLKYVKKGLVFQSPKNPENWAYWERVPEMLPDVASTIANDDKKKRIDKAV